MAATAAVLCPWLGRRIWFDEAITIMNFAMSPYPDIYLDYTIPNNHIAYTYILKTWLEAVGGILPVSELEFRLPSAALAILLVVAALRFWRRRMGFHAAFAAVACLVASAPFAIYGTAVRGYILTTLLVLLGLEAFLRWEEDGKWWRGAIFFLATLGGVATIPSNALAFASLAVLPTPHASRAIAAAAENGLKNGNFRSFILHRILTAALAVAAFLAVYAPLWNALRRALIHNNGWLRPWAACLHLAAGFIVAFWPLLAIAVPGAASLLSATRRKGAPAALLLPAMAAAVFLVPFAAVLARRPAPFPRVFMQMWPIWLYLAGRAATRFMAARRAKGKNPAALLTALLAAAFAAGAVSRIWSAELSSLFTARGSADDFFHPYYMADNFNPPKTVDKLLDLTRGHPKRAFLSQNADFPSIIFYGKLKGVREDYWLFDFPGKTRLANLDPAAGGRVFLVVWNKSDAWLLKNRFSLQNLRRIDAETAQKIFGAETAEWHRLHPKPN